jgi:hypothetical protein
MYLNYKVNNFALVFKILIENYIRILFYFAALVKAKEKWHVYYSKEKYLRKENQMYH